MYKKDKGFTLIELMVILAVLGIISGIAVPNVIKIKEKAHDAAIANVASSINLAMEMYYYENDKYPDADSITNWEELKSVLSVLDIDESEKYNIGSDHQDIEADDVFSYDVKEDGSYELKLASNTTGIIHVLTPDGYQ